MPVSKTLTISSIVSRSVSSMVGWALASRSPRKADAARAGSILSRSRCRSKIRASDWLIAVGDGYERGGPGALPSMPMGEGSEDSQQGDDDVESSEENSGRFCQLGLQGIAWIPARSFWTGPGSTLTRTASCMRALLSGKTRKMVPRLCLRPRPSAARSPSPRALRGQGSSLRRWPVVDRREPAARPDVSCSRSRL